MLYLRIYTLHVLYILRIYKYVIFTRYIYICYIYRHIYMLYLRIYTYVIFTIYIRVIYITYIYICYIYRYIYIGYIYRYICICYIYSYIYIYINDYLSNVRNNTILLSTVCVSIYITYVDM